MPSQAAGYLTFTLHAHLPYVVNHGTWPHGMEWLHEAAAETYLPLLRMLGRLEKDGIGLHCNLNISPILMEQLTHPVFLAEFPNYVTRKIVAAREDEAFFMQSGETHYAETARFWQRFFRQTLEHFQALGGNIVGGFKHFHQAGLIEIITCAATHGYLPLLGTDESVRAQVRVAIQTHMRHLGEHPKGIWSPECGYRPAGEWNYPVTHPDGSPLAPGFDRIGIEQAFSESSLNYFFVDTHLVEESGRTQSPYELRDGQRQDVTDEADARLLYRPHFVEGRRTENLIDDRQFPVTVFARDPRTGLQVWSGERGYPGEASYLDFHKKRWPGGHRYWRVTGQKVAMEHKELYSPQEAEVRVRGHAEHFAHLVHEALQAGFAQPVPQLLCALFDAELFGHWWFEGPLWLEQVARALHDSPNGVKLISCSRYLERFPQADFLAMPEGSWGAAGNDQVWMNPETSWTYTHLYPAELYVREVATEGKWRASELGTRVVRQMCRELLLLESSDWQFLITTGAARDYAELRFVTHHDQFLELKAIWQVFAQQETLSDQQTARLAAIELRDGVFPELDPGFWAAGAKEQRSKAPQA